MEGRACCGGQRPVHRAGAVDVEPPLIVERGRRRNDGAIEGQRLARGVGDGARPVDRGTAEVEGQSRRVDEVDPGGQSDRSTVHRERAQGEGGVEGAGNVGQGERAAAIEGSQLLGPGPAVHREGPARADGEGAGVGKARCGPALVQSQISPAHVQRPAIGVVKARAADRERLADRERPLVIQLRVQEPAAVGPGQ